MIDTIADSQEIGNIDVYGVIQNDENFRMYDAGTGIHEGKI
jgi:hypothetical protein